MLNRDAEFLPRAISKSGAGQLDLLIQKFADYLIQLNCKCCQIC